MILIFFIYGLSFFILGGAILLYPRQDSRFPLSRELIYIALFAILHGINEWLDMFTLMLKPNNTESLVMIGMIILPVSFFFLILFGITHLFKNGKIPLALKILPPALLVIWGIIGITNIHRLVLCDIWARYLLGVPGIFLTSYALFSQARELKGVTLQGITMNVRIASGAFLLYGILSGLIVPEAGFFPASVFNYASFSGLFGFPVQLVRTICAVVIAYNIITTLKLFQYEKDQLLKDKEMELSATIESTSDGILVVNDQGRIINSNSHFAEMWRIPHQLITKNDDEKLLSHVLEQLTEPQAFLSTVNKLYKSSESSVDFLSFKDGRIFERHSRPLILHGVISGRVWSFRDITERKLNDEMLKQSEERYRSLVESTDDSIYVLDRDYRYLFINRKHLARLGVQPEDYIGQSFNDYHEPDEVKRFKEKTARVFTDTISIQYEYKSRRDGHYFLHTISPVLGSDGKVVAITVISTEITELKNMEEILYDLSNKDDLTGLYNRRGFFHLSELQLKLAARENRSLFLLSADFDNLKTINDTLGHNEGSLALIETARILRVSFRDSDIIARIGGDEFVVLAAEIPNITVDSLTNRLNEHLTAYNRDSGKSYQLSLSYGISHYNPEKPCSLETLLIRADKLMYKHKHSRK